MEKIKSKASNSAERAKIDLSARPSTVVHWGSSGVLQFRIIWFCGFQLLQAALPRDAAAYVDPGTTGLLSQILYVLFYAALGGFFYFMRSIERSFVSLKQRLAKLCGCKGKF